MHLHLALACLVAPLAAGLLPAPARSAEAPATADAAGSTRDHVVFLGLDVAVKDPRAEGRVANFTRGTLHVATRDQEVPLRIATVTNVSTIRDPKVARFAATIAEMAAERMFAPHTDPQRRALEQQAQLMAYQAEVEQRARAAEYNLMQAESAAAPSGPGAAAGAADRQANIDRAKDALAGVRQEQNVGNYDPFVLADKTRNSGADLFDSFTVTFRLSSDVSFERGYVVLVATIRAPESPEVPFNVFEFQEVSNVSAKPQKIRLVQQGLPAGFVLEDYEIHVYTTDGEVATNLAKNRVDVSREEAHQFLILRHTVTHQGKTEAAVPAHGLLPEQNRRAIPDDRRGETADVHVDRNGVVTSVALGTPGDPAQDAAMIAAIRATPFLPALVAGAPVDSQTTVFFSELVR